MTEVALLAIHHHLPVLALRTLQTGMQALMQSAMFGLACLALATQLPDTDILTLPCAACVFLTSLRALRDFLFAFGRHTLPQTALASVLPAFLHMLVIIGAKHGLISEGDGTGQDRTL